MRPCTGSGLGVFILYNNQFVYSSNGKYAVGIANGTFGSYYAFEYGAVGAPIYQWYPSPYNNPCFAVQADNNMVW